VVFFPTARATAFYAALFKRLALPNPHAPPGAPPLRLEVVEMHSRVSQAQRGAAAERFRGGSGGLVMFSSDVSARGMDYPGVTEVLQVGLTDRESYIHRLGRTARAGREGAGLLLLSDYEARALLPELADLPIRPAGPASVLTGGEGCGLPGYVPPARGAEGGGGDAGASFVQQFGQCAPVANLPCVSALLASLGREPELLKAANLAYGASLGFLNGPSRRFGWEKADLVRTMNELFLTLGCPEVPVMPKDTLGKMGLRGTPGLREGPSLKASGGSGGGGGSSGGRGGGSGGGSGRGSGSSSGGRGGGSGARR
jgi:ATP-dependent RNA helicase MSS116